MGTAFNREQLQTVLAVLVQQNLLIREDSSWRSAAPLITRVQKHELTRNIVQLLAEDTRRKHPLYVESRNFLARAGFTVLQSDLFGFLCTSDMLLWSDISPLYIWPVLERALDLDEFQALHKAARIAYDGDLQNHVVVVVIDQPPQAADLYQIFALRAQRGLTVVPLPQSLMTRAQIDNRVIEAFKDQVDRYAGKEDLYDKHSAVTDVLSFFGRNEILTNLQRRLTNGNSVVVYGLRKIGKSSLLGRLREESGWLPALIDLEGYDRGLQYLYGEALRRWRAALQVNAVNAIPELSWDPVALPDSASQSQAFRYGISALLDYLALQPGRPGLLLFLDEVDFLVTQPQYLELAAVLRSVAEDPRWQGRFAILAAGLDPTLTRVDHMFGGRNPFFAFFSEFPLGPLEPDAVRSMIISLGNQMGISYNPRALDILSSVGGGHPLLTRQLCSEAIRGLDRPAVVDAPRVQTAVNSYLRRAENYMAQSLWLIDTGGPPTQEAAILTALAIRQPQTDADLMSAELNIVIRRALHLAIDHLHDRSLIRHEEAGWFLTIPLYRHYIRRYILHLPDDDLEGVLREYSESV